MVPNEILQHIFSFIKDDFKTLHSIIFVNRTWCSNGMKILWKNPLEYDIYSINQSKVVNVLLSYVNTEKLLMEENNITTNSFNYPSFVTHLNLSMVVKVVWDFFAATREELEVFGHTQAPQLKFDDNPSKFEQLITIVLSIFKIISNSEANIEKLELVLDEEDLMLFLDLDDTIKTKYLLLKKIDKLLSCFFKTKISESWLENLKYLYCGKNITKVNVLNPLSNICKNLSILKIIEEDFTRIQETLTRMIKQQRNLEYIQIVGNDKYTEIISALESIPNPNLFKKIELINLHISNDKALKSLVKFKNLECLHLKGLHLPYKNFEYVAAAEFPKLTSLILVDNYGAFDLDREPYTTLIQNKKISSNLTVLQLIKCAVNNNLELLKAIDLNCRNLLDFAIQITKQEDIPYLFSILNNCPMIKKFHLEPNPINNSKFIDDLVKNLPGNLVELKLKDLFDTFDDFQKFFKSCEVDLKFFVLNIEEFVDIEQFQEFIEEWSEKKEKKVVSCKLVYRDNSIEICWK